MDIKKYESFQLQDAIKMVKMELGKDAVIISTKEKEIFSSEKGKKCKIYEVMAAPNVSNQSKILSPSIGEHLQRVEFPQVNRKNEAIVVKDKKPQTIPSMSSLSPELNAQILSQNRTFELQREKLFQKENPLKSQPQDSLAYDDIKSLKSDLSKVKRDLELLPQIDVLEQMQEMKILLHDLIKNNQKKTSENENPFIFDIVTKLRTAGVLEVVVSQLITWLKSLESPFQKDVSEISNNKMKDFYINETIKFIFKNLKVTGPFQNKTGQQKIICFVGPTGVGKTTTMAKIGARLSIQEKKKIDFISMDHFRVAASEQLRVYSKILECPFFDCSDVDELTKLVSKRTASDFIFIDTSGRSVRFSDQLESLKMLINAPIPIEFHLVISCSTKQRDIEEIVRGFKFLNIHSLVFTKLDESWGFGEILNVSTIHKIPLSYFATGQRVPEDLEVASKERVAERLLKL